MEKIINKLFSDYLSEQNIASKPESLYRHIATDSQRLILYVLSLIVVKIHIGIGRHDAVVSMLRSLKATTDATP